MERASSHSRAVWLGLTSSFALGIGTGALLFGGSYSPLRPGRADEPPPARQNPSPMVEHIRSHPRLPKQEPPGQRFRLEIGQLFIPASLADQKHLPLLLHFHGGGWLPEVAAAKVNKAAVVSIQIGSGSGVYAKAFADSKRFSSLVEEAERQSGASFAPIALSCWSAGYGAIRTILSDRDSYARVSRVLLIDGLHTSYIGGVPGPLESRIETEPLGVFLEFARDAAAGKKRMLITHSEIFPGTFASTTETADYLLQSLDLKPTATLVWGPSRMQQLGEARRGNLTIRSYAGNSAPDHVDQLHALPELLAELDWDPNP